MTNMKMAITNTLSITDLARNLSKAVDSLKSGAKVIVKNNKPEAVLMSTEDYLEMIEEIEDLQDTLLVMERIKSGDVDGGIDQETVMKMFGISEYDLKDVEVEIEWNGKSNTLKKPLEI